MRRAALGLAILALAGCAVTRKADQPMTLRLAPLASAAGTRAPGPIVVAPVQARGAAGALRYTYIDASAPAEIRQARTIFWERPPAQVVEDALVDGLRTRFATVVAGGVAPAGARRVTAVLDRFEEVSAGGDAQATVAFAATLGGAPMSAGRYCARAPIADARGTTRARAFEAAIGRAVAAFVQDAAAGALSSTAC